ncbi:hypothetical protein E1176_01670, partial [Fulvivirga sp. RKSG066]|uniref:hypothetical protein n=1 Tax=Fulvivirga aurantia TaxID=2529383 RepID=UPI0012BC780D
MVKIFGFILIFLLSYGLKAQDTSQLVLGLSNGEVIYPHSLKHKTPAFGKSHFIIDDSVRFEKAQVAYYQNAQGYFLKADPEGFGSEFYLREIHGPRISAFSTVKTYYSPGSPGMGVPGGTFHSTTVDYYKKKYGLLKKLTLNNLNRDLSDNTQSRLYLTKVKKINTINTFLYLGGA